MSKQTAVRLPDELNERLTLLAKRTGRTASYYLREALEEYIDEMEDIYLAEQTLARVRRGEERTYSLDEVEHELGLEN
jgi:RHH-type rel operon transcriptional repressor/antitoxin RelB